MSEQGVRALLERAQADSAFREQLEAAPSTEARRQVIEDAGFDVGPSDLAAFRSLAGVQELSEDDLERVAGAGSATNVSIGASLGASATVSVGVAVAAAFIA